MAATPSVSMVTVSGRRTVKTTILHLSFRHSPRWPLRARTWQPLTALTYAPLPAARSSARSLRQASATAVRTAAGARTSGLPGAAARRKRWARPKRISSRSVSVSSVQKKCSASVSRRSAATVSLTQSLPRLCSSRDVTVSFTSALARPAARTVAASPRLSCNKSSSTNSTSQTFSTICKRTRKSRITTP